MVVADTSIITGVMLIFLGAWGFFGTGMHPTALIPAGVGLLLGILGAVGRNDAMRKHAMHGAAAVALLGFIGSVVMIVPALPQLFTQGHVTHGDGTDATGSFLSKCAMAALCAGFLALCIKSFIDARRRRKAEAQAPAAPQGLAGRK